jgi:hypothetical protein
MDQIASVISTEQFKKHGHLLKPFGWATDRLIGIVTEHPELLADLLRIDCPRMHLIALIFAFLNREATSDMGEFLIHGSVRAITEKALSHYPRGIKRALRCLPSSVLDPESYRQLVELLADKTTFLNHVVYVDEHWIKTLYGLPPVLRTASMLDAIDFRGSFSDGLRLLISRGGAGSFEALVSEFASFSDVSQICSTLARLIENLPLATAFPPEQIEKARRIDQSIEIRSLAKTWKNCLEEYLPKIHACSCAVYLWEDGDSTVACLVERHGRLGWFLYQISGPQNARVAPQQFEKIRLAFSEVDIPPFEIIGAISQMVGPPGR